MPFVAAGAVVVVGLVLIAGAVAMNRRSSVAREDLEDAARMSAQTEDPLVKTGGSR